MANLRKWSTTATSNATVAGGLNTINLAEGQSPGSVNNSMRELMAQLRSVYVPDQWGWVEHSATASVASQTTFKISGDQTSYWTQDRRWRLVSGSSTRYGSVISSSYTVETTVTVSVDSGSLSASHSIAAIAAPSVNAIPRATAAQFRANSADRALMPTGVWGAADTVALTWNSGGTTTVDLSVGINFTVTTASGNSTLSPVNAKTGQSGFIYITQDGTTARSVTFASSFVHAGGTDPTLTATPGAKDVYFYEVLSATGPVILGSLVKNVS